MSQEILATVEASAPRRAFGVGVLALLGALLIYVAFMRPPAVLGWQIFLLALGAVALALAAKMWRATEGRVELTQEGLRDSEGTVIATISQIERLDRGMFAAKPSNGFMLRLSEAPGGRWQPGLWWRMGKRVGIGGVTPGAQTKVMSEMISALMSEHQRR